MSTTVYFMRHGQSEANLQNRYAVDDTPLSELGKRQADEASATPNLPPFRSIYSSDLPRARETAEIVARRLGFSPAQIVLDPRLREVNVGLLKGQADQHMVGYFEAAAKPENPLKVELPAEVEARLAAFVESLRGQDGAILIVGHSGSGIILRQLIDHQELELSAHDNLVNGQIVKFGELPS